MTDIVTRLRDAGQQLLEPGSSHELCTVLIDDVELPIYANAPQTLREALAAGRAHGDNTFIVYEGENWSFDRFFEQVQLQQAVGQ